MKKICSLLVMLVSFVLVNGCSCKKDENNKIEYVHYLRGGGSEEIEATILWEYANDVYTKYQVAYTSYVCSDPSVNYTNVIYLEIINLGTKEDAQIRNISFSTLIENDTEFNVGMWGDYKSAIRKEFYPGIESELLPKLKDAKYSFIEQVSQNGYGNYKSIEGINSDAIMGGTVSGSNIVSIVKAVFDYHIDKYY